MVSPATALADRGSRGRGASDRARIPAHGAPAGRALKSAGAEPGFARLATLAYTEIALYGAGSPQVCRRLLAAYNVLEGLTEGSRREVIRELRQRTLTTFEEAIPAPFHEVSAEPDRLGFG